MKITVPSIVNIYFLLKSIKKSINLQQLNHILGVYQFVLVLRRTFSVSFWTLAVALEVQLNSSKGLNKQYVKAFFNIK
jgi:hypothetical protein